MQAAPAVRCRRLDRRARKLRPGWSECRQGDRPPRAGGRGEAIVRNLAAARSVLGECTSGEPGAGRPVGAAARTRKQRRPRSRRTLAELSKCRGPANARDACREASDEQAPEQGTPCRFGERSSEPAARSALTSRGSAPTTTSGGEYYPPLGGVAASARESAEGRVQADANPVSQPSRVYALGNPQRTRSGQPVSSSFVYWSSGTTTTYGRDAALVLPDRASRAVRKPAAPGFEAVERDNLSLGRRPRGQPERASGSTSLRRTRCVGVHASPAAIAASVPMITLPVWCSGSSGPAR
jgi:hypothetical protein